MHPAILLVNHGDAAVSGSQTTIISVGVGTSVPVISVAGPGITVINAGTIGTVDLATTSSSRLIVAPGGVFTGQAEANPQVSNVLELASGSSTGVISGLGT